MDRITQRVWGLASLLRLLRPWCGQTAHANALSPRHAHLRTRQHPAVRGAAVDALTALYAEPSNVSPLHTFADRFTHRFLELPNDVDESVAIKGVRAGRRAVSLRLRCL